MKGTAGSRTPGEHRPNYKKYLVARDGEGGKQLQISLKIVASVLKVIKIAMFLVN